MRHVLYIMFFVLSAFPHIPYAKSPDSFSFPVYSIDMAPEDLAALEKNPYSDTTYPATFSYSDITIECSVRFRGATSRWYPKKSWKIKFDDDDNPFHVEELNLNADYYDQTMLRSYLATRLYDYMGAPSPSSSHVNLNVNNKHRGMFIQVEQVDEQFLERQDRDPGNLYKALNHAANMAPLAHDSDYPTIWEPKDGTPPDSRDLKKFLNKVYYWSGEDFTSQIESVLNVDEFITCYAVTFSIAGIDNFTKNYYLYHNPTTGKFEVFPWDFDSTFGTNHLGVYNEYNESFIYGYSLDYHVLFRRLMEHEPWRNQFWNTVEHITTEGFSYIETCIDSIYSDLQHDITLDTTKYGENEAFADAVNLLRSFLTKRRVALASANGFYQIPLTDIEVDSPFIGRGETDITLRIQSTAPQLIYCRFTENFKLPTFAETYSTSKFRLFDDGNSYDNEYADNIYGVNITLPEGFRGYVPITFQANGLKYPWNGFHYLNYFRNHGIILNAMNTYPGDIDSLYIGNCYNFNGESAVEIVNHSIRTLDISFMYLQCGEYYNRILFPENTVIGSGERLLVTSNTLFATPFFPNDTILENSCPAIAINDTLALLAPDLSLVKKCVCEDLQLITVETDTIVINEINYHSADEFDTGDWIELYNSENYTVDLSGWILLDSNDDHHFIFPDQTVLGPNKYIIVTCDVPKFECCFPEIIPIKDEIDFGFDGSGETIRLYNSNLVLVDSLTYDDDWPWPEEADGAGATLSLINPTYDNAMPDNWAASLSHGTPGERNDVFTGIGGEVPDIINSDGLMCNGCFPNPFNASTTIPFSLTYESVVTINIYSVSGQHIRTLLDERIAPGDHVARFEGEDLPSGIYFYHIVSTYSNISGKMVLVK